MNSTTEIHINQKTQSSSGFQSLSIISSEATNLELPQFEDALLTALDTAFYSLGCKQEIYRQLETEHGLNKQIIHKNIGAFVEAIENIFGEAVVLLELKIIYYLHAQVYGFNYYGYTQDWTFTKYLEKLKSYLA